MAKSKLLATCFTVACSLLAFASLSPSDAAQQKKQTTWTDLDDTTLPADFKFQGEYVGEFHSGGKLGAQVIALGSDSFQAVLFVGGLPGDGWDGKNRILMDGKRDGTKTAFTATAGNRKYIAKKAETFSATAKFPPPGHQECMATLAEPANNVNQEKINALSAEIEKLQQEKRKAEVTLAFLILELDSMTSLYNIEVETNSVFSPLAKALEKEVKKLGDGLPGARGGVENHVRELSDKLRQKTALEQPKVMIGKTDDGQTFELTKTFRKSPTIGLKPPKGALVLFDGTSLKAFNGGRFDKKNGTLNTDGKDITTKKKFLNCSAHLEFYLPYRPAARGQERANSGFYMANLYEVQILDSFGLEGKNNECGGVYQLLSPKVNMCLPPLQWQTYDIEFASAILDEQGKNVKKARLTVKHNGVVIHDDAEVNGPTGGARQEPEGTPGPLLLQGHGNPLQFKNVWVVEKK